MALSALFSAQAQMFLMLAAGLILRRLHVIRAEDTHCLSGIMMYVLLPCSVVNAYFGTDLSTFSSMSWIIVISIAQQLFTYVLSLFFWRSYPREKRAVLRYGLQFSNCGFIGLPVAESLYGPSGLIYASIYNLPINVFMWTTGLGAFVKERSSWKNVLSHVLRHPCMVATYFGFLVMFSPFPWPDFLTGTIHHFSSALSPISMLLVGSLLAEADLKSLFQKDVVLTSLARLLLVPLFVVLVSIPMKLPALAVEVSATQAGMPIGSMAAVLAHTYRCDDALASNCVVFSTVLSLVTVPLLYMIMNACL